MRREHYNITLVNNLELFLWFFVYREILDIQILNFLGKRNKDIQISRKLIIIFNIYASRDIFLYL